MQCHNCRSQLLEGVAFCQQCGAPVTPPSIAPTIAAPLPSYNNSGPDAGYNPIAPTIAAFPPASGGSDANYDPQAPTIAAPPPSYGNPPPYTNYNPPSAPGSGQAYETVQNPYSNVPYGQPQSGNTPSYGQPQPGNVPPYNQPQFGDVPPYTPPPNNMPPYTPPSQSNNASYGMGAPAFPGTAPAKPKSKVGLIIGIVAAVLLFACVGSVIAVGVLANKASQSITTGLQTSTVDSTPTIAPTPTTVLSGNTVDPTAASIVTNIQMASDVNKGTAEPKTLSTSFLTGDTVYVTYQFDFRNTDVTQQKPGYTQAEYYIGNTLYHTTKPLTIDDTVAPNGQGFGYFGYPYDTATAAGTVEVYWCRQSDCADRLLAGTSTFTVG